MALARVQIARELIVQVFSQGTESSDPLQPEEGILIIEARMVNAGRTLELLIDRPSAPAQAAGAAIPIWAPAFRRRAVT
jgi:hypothetical protein